MILNWFETVCMEGIETRHRNQETDFVYLNWKIKLCKNKSTQQTKKKITDIEITASIKASLLKIKKIEGEENENWEV